MLFSAEDQLHSSPKNINVQNVRSTNIYCLRHLRNFDSPKSEKNTPNESDEEDTKGKIVSNRFHFNVIRYGGPAFSPQ